jgi:hypothetical protein
MAPITVFEEVACLFFAILWLSKKGAGYWAGFIWFMLFTVIVETIGWLLHIYYPKQHNHWLYNIEMIVEVLFLAWIFYRILQPLFNSKPWIITGLTLFFVSYIIEGYPSRYIRYNYLTDSLAAVLFVIASGAYFYFLLKNEGYVTLFRHPEFWLVAGIFFFYFGSTAANLLFQELMTYNIAKGVSIRFIIFPVLNAILYGCWSYAFRCRYLQIISFS